MDILLLKVRGKALAFTVKYDVRCIFFFADAFYQVDKMPFIRLIKVEVTL